MKMKWQNLQVFRDAEGEGAGGSGEGAGTPAPSGEQPDRLSALESRLDRITSSLDNMAGETKQRQAQGAIAARDRELETAKNTADAAVGTAEAALASAYDEGEGLEIAKAQRALTEAVATRERADMSLTDFRAAVKAAEKKQAEAPKGDQGDDTNLKAWKAKHASWYGVDATMTKASHEIDRQIRDAGVISVGSQAYFDAVDKQMAQRYPEKFNQVPPTAGEGGVNNPNPTPRKGRIAQSIADGWRRMGIDTSDPKVVDRMLKNRETAVQKGILPTEPVTGPVITR